MRDYFELVRLPNVFTAVADVAMGFLVTHAAFGTFEGWGPRDGWIFALLAAASAGLYSAGMVLNDVFDLEVDTQERPWRPLPSGRISLGAARWLGCELLLVGVALAWVAGFLAGGLRPGVVACMLAACVVLYDGYLKRTPLGPPAMGACRMLNVLLGMSAAAGPWQPAHWLVAAAMGTYVVGVTWFARTEARKSNRLHLGLATAVMMLGIALVALFGRLAEDVGPLLGRQPDRWYLLMTVLGVLIGWRCLSAVIEPVPQQVQRAVKQCILSIVVLDAAACLAVCGTRWAIMILLLLVPTMVLRRWMYST